MNKIPEQLRTDDARFIKIESNGKKPVEKWDNPNNQYKYNDKELQDWINNGGNYAIINASMSLVIIDADNKKCGQLIVKNLPKTMIIKTHGDRFHAYYKNPDSKIDGKKILKDGMGDIRFYKGEKSNYYTICAGSIHPSGSEYVSNNVEIATVEDKDILDTFKDYFKSKKKRISNIKKGVKEGERNESSFVLACKYRDKKLDIEETLELMKAWNKKNEPPIDEEELEATIESAYSYEDDEKEVEDEPKLTEKMKQSDLLISIIEEVQKEGLIGEEDTIIAITLKIMLRLVKNATPTSSNVVISDKSGGGKDWLTKCICSVLLKKGDYFHRSRLTEKVFTYWHNKKKNFTWDGKVIHLEDPDAEFLNSQAFKVRASGETEETIVKDQKAIDVKVDGKPVIIVTSLTASLNIESVRRWDSCRIDTSEELTKLIMTINALKETGQLTIEKDEELRKALQTLPAGEVIVPYAVAVTEVLPNTLGMRTAHHKFIDFIKASAVLHQYQRKRTEDGKIIANIFDYEAARFCFYKFGNMKGVPLNIAEEEVIDVLLRENRPMKIKEILPHISRGQQWLYDKIDRLKELDCIKELYILDDQANKDVKHLIANEKMAWRTLVDGREILKIYNERCKNSGFPEVLRGFPIGKYISDNGRMLYSKDGGFSNFQKNVLHKLKESISNNKNQYITFLGNFGKPTTNDDDLTGVEQEKNKIGKPMENPPKTPRIDWKTTQRLHEKLKKLRDYVKNNRESGFTITYETLTYSFDKDFIDECIARQILVKNGKDYICR